MSQELESKQSGYNEELGYKESPKQGRPLAPIKDGWDIAKILISLLTPIAIAIGTFVLQSSLAHTERDETKFRVAVDILRQPLGERRSTERLDRWAQDFVVRYLDLPKGTPVKDLYPILPPSFISTAEAVAVPMTRVLIGINTDKISEKDKTRLVQWCRTNGGQPNLVLTDCVQPNVPDYRRIRVEPNGETNRWVFGLWAAVHLNHAPGGLSEEKIDGLLQSLDNPGHCIIRCTNEYEKDLAYGRFLLDAPNRTGVEK